MESFPFTSFVTYDEEGQPEYDRAVDSLILRNFLKQYVINGVFPNPSTNFQVVSNGGMTVKVKPGSCIINGATAYEDEDRILSIQASEASDRIDTVVLRLNDDTDYRNIDLYIRKGTAAATPVAPVLTRETSVYELGIANLFVSKNSSVITQERITDTRLDTNRCGLASFMQKIDTQTFYTQIQADLTKFKNTEEKDFSDWAKARENEIENWFKELSAMVDQNDVVAINNQLIYIKNNYVVGKGIELAIRNNTLAIIYDDEDWTVN